MKTVLLTALTCALFVTACQKEESANLQENNTQVVEPAAKGAILADAADLSKIPVLVVSDGSPTARKRKTNTITPPPPTDTTTKPPPPTDTIISVPPPTTAIPSSYSLIMPPVGNQGYEGSCVAWATAYAARSCKQYYATNAFSYSYSSNIYSPEFVFNQIKLGTNCGSSAMMYAMDLLVKQGVCTWQSMPYSATNGCSLLPTTGQTSEAAGYKIASYARVYPNDPVTIKTMIASKKAIPFTCNTDYNFKYYTAGTVWTAYAGFSGSHAMVICGYDDAKHAYKVMNSWGATWGDAGYLWIDYNLLPVISYEAYVMN
jgi:C1A family cysteine protease